MALANELIDHWGVSKVDHLADLDESQIRAVAATAKLPPRHTNRLVKLWAQIAGGGQVKASLFSPSPSPGPDRLPAFPQAPTGSTSSVGGGSVVRLPPPSLPPVPPN